MQIKKVMSLGLSATIRELTEIARLSPSDVLAQLSSSPEGLYQREAEEQLRIYGQNDAVCEARWDRIWRYFERLRNNLILPMVSATVVLIFIGKTDAGWVMSMVLLISVFLTLAYSCFFGNYRKKLRSVTGLTAKLHRRDHGDDCSTETDSGLIFRKIPLPMLVPGDVIAFAAGDKVPADVRLIKADNMMIDQSLFSGSSLPVKKHAEADFANASNSIDLENICLMGSSVVCGSGVGVVLLTGTRTWFGRTKAWRNYKK
jgi:Mg2+-importing ATPase